MNEPASPSIWARSPLAHFFRWLFSWRGARRILIVTAWAVTIIVLFYGIENWRGRRAWKKHEDQLLARGEQLDFKAFFPKPVPDEQNFAATPFVASWSLRLNDSDIWPDGPYQRVVNKISTRRNDPHRYLVDLVAWQMGLEADRAGTLERETPFRSEKTDRESRRTAALAILESMKTIEPKIAEMRAASARSYARYPIEFKDDPWSLALPHLAKIKGTCQRLRLKASAELAAGQSAAALEDVKLLLYLADSIKDEPLVISYLVRIACREFAIHVIWEGLAQHAWSDAQLQELQTRVTDRDFLQNLARNLKAEHAAGIITPDLIRKFGIKYVFALGDSLDLDSSDWISKPLLLVLGNLAPSGWIYQEKFNYSRLFQMQQQPLLSETGAVRPRISPSEVKAAGHKMEDELAYKHRFAGSAINHTVFASLLLPALGNISMRAATGQTSTDHAALACALERYRLANGNFPEKLDALVPQFIAQLPNDLITGEPYKYRRIDDGQFVLYSVGWDEKDDAGTPGERLYDSRRGDWIWDYSSTRTQPPQKAVAPPSSPAKTQDSKKTVLQRLAASDASVFKLSPEQVEAFLAKSTNPESLLAAFNATGDKELLRQALQRFPDHPFVLAAALTHDASPEQRRELIEQFKRLAPDNPMANYLAARDQIKSQPELALRELTEAASKNGFHDFTIERIQGLEDIYLDAGYTPVEAKALAMAGVQLKSIVQLRQLGGDISALQKQYAASGDAATAEMLARIGLTLASDITQGTGNTFIGQMTGSRVEQELLRALDPNTTYDFIPQPISDRLAHLQAQDKSIREACQFFDQWMRTASDGQLVSFFDRLKLYGEPAAVTWARTQVGHAAP